MRACVRGCVCAFCTFISTGAIESLFPCEGLQDLVPGGRGRVALVDGVGLWSGGLQARLLQRLDEKLFTGQPEQPCLRKSRTVICLYSPRSL